MLAKPCALLLVLVSVSACDKSTPAAPDKPETSTEPSEAPSPELVKATGLACYFPDIADAETLRLRLDGGKAVGLAIDYTGPKDRESRLREGSEFSAAPEGQPPLGTYTAKVGNKAVKLVLTGTGSGEHSQYRGHLVDYEGSAKTNVNCYRITED